MAIVKAAIVYAKNQPFTHVRISTWDKPVRIIRPNAYDIKHFGPGVYRVETGHANISSLPIKIHPCNTPVKDTANKSTIGCRVEFLTYQELSIFRDGTLEYYYP